MSWLVQAAEAARAVLPVAVSSFLPPPPTPPLPPAPPLAPFPHLPFELVLLILSHSLPPHPSFSSSPRRAQQLKHYALLSKDSARWAVLELRRDVRLSTTDSARWFAGMAKRKGRHWSGGVRVLRLGNAVKQEDQHEGVDSMWRGEGVGGLIEELLRVLESVEELWICGMGGIEIGNLREGKSLRKLYITETRLVPTTSPSSPDLHLPLLHSLYLKSVIFTGPSLAQFLSPDSLPALRTLDYLSVHQSLVSPLGGMFQPRAPAAPGGGAGGQGLATMTASLAALTTNTTASPSSSLIAAQQSHPVLTLSPHLTSLSLGPHSTRTLPLSLLSSRGFALHFPSLISLSLPWSMALATGSSSFAPLAPEDYPSTLRHLRVTTEGRADPQGMYPVDKARNMRDGHEKVEEKALAVLAHCVDSSSSSLRQGDGELSYTLTLPKFESRWSRFLPPPSQPTSSSSSDPFPTSSTAPLNASTSRSRPPNLRRGLAAAAVEVAASSRAASPARGPPSSSDETSAGGEDDERGREARRGDGEDQWGRGKVVELPGSEATVRVKVEYEDEKDLEEKRGGRDGVWERGAERWRERVVGRYGGE